MTARSLALALSLLFALPAAAQGPHAPADARLVAPRMPVLPEPRGAAAIEPADSLYRLARAALTEGDFRKAAQLFQLVADRYPDSEYAPDALYYRAYALYRSGGSRELEAAVLALDRQGTRYPRAGTLNDARQLRASIRAEQAKRGDGKAGLEIAAGAKALGNERRCPTEEDDVTFTALAGLVQMDPDQVLPVLQKLLDRRDECSVSLRRRAVYMVAQTREEERADMLLRVARNDPSTDVRREAVQWLSQVNTERAARALDSILFSATDADLQQKAMYSLSQHRSPIAKVALRRFAELGSMPTDQRVRAVYYIGQGRRTGDEGDYLRALYAKTASPDLREAIIQAVANQRSPDRTAWLLGVARDRGQEVEPRKRALFYAGQSGLELKDLIALYDELDKQPEMQDQLLYVYAQRKEPEATEKLIQIARAERQPELRRKAIFWLGQRKDPRAKQFLLELLNQ